jgi:hypothetical protein
VFLTPPPFGPRPEDWAQLAPSAPIHPCARFGHVTIRPRRALLSRVLNQGVIVPSRSRGLFVEEAEPGWDEADEMLCLVPYPAPPSPNGIASAPGRMGALASSDSVAEVERTPLTDTREASRSRLGKPLAERR